MTFRGVWIPVSSSRCPRAALFQCQTLIYFLLASFHCLCYLPPCPVWDGWRAALKRTLIPGRETEGRGVEESLGADKFGADSKENFLLGSPSSCVPDWFVGLWLWCIIWSKRSKGGFTDGRQRPIITTSPEEHRRVRAPENTVDIVCRCPAAV